MTEKTTDIEVAETPEVDPSLVAVVRELLDSHDAEQRKTVVATIAALRKPDRSTLKEISLPAERETREQPQSLDRAIPYGTGRPLDLFYRKLHRDVPGLAECRTEEIDHWNHQWMMALIGRNMSVQLDAFNRAEAAFRKHVRGTTLEGDIATDPTGILDGTGGSLLPQPFSRAVEIAREAAAVIGALGMNYPMSSAPLRIPTAGAATAIKRAEGQAVAQGEPSYASVMLRAEALTCFMKASREFMADNAQNALSLFQSRAGRAIGAQEDVDFLTSDGVSPNASAPLEGGALTEATITVLTIADLFTIYHAVSKTDRTQGCAWLGDNEMMSFLEELVDTNGRQMLTRADTPIMPIGDLPQAEGMILGFPVYEVPATAGDLIFGNIRQGYAVGRREGITARVSDQAEFSAGLIQFMIEERYDGNIQEAAAIKEFQGITSTA